MGSNSTKSPLTTAEFALRFSATNNFYRTKTSIKGQLDINIHGKLYVEKKIRIDLIGQLIETEKSEGVLSQSYNNGIFFSFSYPLVTSNENGTAKLLKKEKHFTFQIPIGANLPPSCQFKHFSVVYYFDVYHDEKLLIDLRKEIILVSPKPTIHNSLLCATQTSDGVKITCDLQKSVYSGRDTPFIPIFLSIANPYNRIITSIRTSLMQIVLLNDVKAEYEINYIAINEIEEKFTNKQFELELSTTLPSTYKPNENGQPDNLPSICIIYEIRLIAQIKNFKDLNLSIPIHIE